MNMNIHRIVNLHININPKLTRQTHAQIYTFIEYTYKCITIKVNTNTITNIDTNIHVHLNMSIAIHISITRHITRNANIL